MQNDRILITGSSGTVGTALAKRLLEEGYDVTGVDIVPNKWSDQVNNRTLELDLTEKSPEQLGDYLPDDIDLVVHLAANARVYKLVQNPQKAKDNFDMVFTTLEYARNVNADFVFSSSREVYGNKSKIVHSETDTFVDECESPYTASKVGGEALVKSYEQCYDMDTAILRFSNVYGRFDDSDRVIPLFIAQALSNEDLTVYGEGKVLDFTYLDDCVSGLESVITNFHRAKSSTFNIASGEGTALVELAEYISEHINNDISINVEPNRRGEVMRFVADISKAQKLIGYEPEFSFETGIKHTLDWYRDNEHLIDNILS